MDYAQLAEMKPKFKGLLTNLLSEGFYEEESWELTDMVEEQIDHQKFHPQRLKDLFKPFT